MHDPSAVGYSAWRRGCAAALIVLATAPVLLAPVAYALERGTLRAAGLGLAVGAYSFFPGLVLAAVLLPVASGSVQRLGIARRWSVVGLVLGGGLWWIIGGAGFIDRRYDDPSTTPLRRELANVASQQEIHWADVASYGATLEEISHVPGSDVILTMEATPDGWSARAVHSRDPAHSCALYFGDVARPLGTSGGLVPSAPGELACEPPEPGPIGRLLHRYHEALEIRETLGPF